MNAVYLAGPIFGKSDAECCDWRNLATKRLSEKFKILDPMSRDYRGKERDVARRIVEGDIRDISEADTILAFCESPSWGTAMEIRVAFDSHKRIIVVADRHTASPWLSYHATAMFPTVGDACTYLLRAV